MNIIYSPESKIAPQTHYSDAVEVPPNSRLLFISGQVGMHPDGSIPDGIEAQTELALKNMMLTLETAGMGLEDLVQTTAFIARSEDFAGFQQARTRVFGDKARPGSIGVIAGQWKYKILIEIAAIAAKAPD